MRRCLSFELQARENALVLAPDGKIFPLVRVIDRLRFCRYLSNRSPNNIFPSLTT